MSRALVALALIGFVGAIYYFYPRPVRETQSRVFVPPPPVTVEVKEPVLREPSLVPVRTAARVGLPIEGLKPTDVHDMYDQARGDRVHEATDIMAPRGTPVVAVSDGIVKKLFNSKPGGLTVYQFDPTETHAYYYAHLDRYADGLHEGQYLKRGDRVGDVGSTGNANPAAPHLHFAIFELGPEKRWYEGKAINPYTLLMENFTGR